MEQGGARVERAGGLIRLVRPATDRASYANAQVGDRATPLLRRPPLVLRLRARYSHPSAALFGTSGFGFWNAALSPGSLRPRLPRAIWVFVSSPPHDMPLALGVPGSGPKFAVLDAGRPTFLALLPFAPPGFLAMRVPPLYRRFWPFAQWAVGVDESPLSGVDLSEWHDYELDWKVGRAALSIDGRAVFETTRSPSGPLALVAWIDNAYGVATPWGRFEIGTVAAPAEQSLEIEGLEIVEGAGAKAGGAP